LSEFRFYRWAKRFHEILNGNRYDPAVEWGNSEMKNATSQRNRRAAAVLFSLGLYFLTMLIGGLFLTVNKTNEIETRRNEKLVASILQSQLSGIQSVADDNAFWDEAARAVYTPHPNQSFLNDSFASATANSTNYSMVSIANQAGQQIWAGENGNVVNFDSSKRFGPGYLELMKGLSEQSPSAAQFATDQNGLVLLGAARIRYSDPEKNQTLAERGFATILMMRRLDNGLISKLGKQLEMSGFRLSQSPIAAASFPLKANDGKVIGYLNWRTSTNRWVVVQDVLPYLAAGVVLFFISLSIAWSFGYQMVKRLELQAMTDSLSQMPNRRALLLAIRAEQKKSQAHALALIDLDGFKYVNDSYGHAVGDRLIKRIAKMLIKEVGNDGIVARLGGDEFAILLAGKNIEQRIANVSARFLDSLRLPVMVEDRSLSLGASIGLVATHETLKGEGELFRRADVAMYQAKQLGKMRAEWYDPTLDEEQAIANELAAELRHSLNVGELEVVYQPIVEVGDAHCRSVEALARWNSPTRGAISPEVFIPIAENTGLIDAIGLFVLRRACNDVRDQDDMRLAVNVSAAQLRNPMFPKELQSILAETNFDPKRLELEITETYLIANTSLAQKVIEGVTALGVTISLDDFGTGYASIGFLRQFAFGKLKIDRSLVNEAQHDEAARMLVQVSVAAARALNMIVTAEGIETQAQADLMKVAGCDQLQGWFYGRPMECSDLTVMLNDASELREKAGLSRT
jgi:diguanylate cyclase (GGDEF)-like protein